jgi:hypothetical protein
MKRAIGAICFLFVAMPLGACSTTTGGKPANVVTMTVTKTVFGRQTEPTSTAASSGSSPTPTTPVSDTSPFGQAFEYNDGLVVRISKPSPYVPSAIVHDLEDKHHRYYLRFLVTIVNGSTKKYEQTLFSTTLQSGQREGEEIFDSAKGFNGSPNTVLLPSRSSKFKIA